MLSQFKVAACFAVLSTDGFRHRQSKAQESSGGCADAASAVVATMNCITNGDSSCANQGYSRRGFEKIHNANKVVQQPWPAETYWSSAMKYSSFTTYVNYQANVGKNQAEIRYIENIVMDDGSSFGRSPSSTYPFSATFKQYEHALVTVDDDCRILKWDQYGDNKEQSDVEDAINAMNAQVGSSGASLAAEEESSGACADPLTSIIETMTCITNKNSSCANLGYNWLRFNKYHNGKNAGVQLWPVDIYWSMAMKFSTFTLDYDYTQNIGTNQASVRYVETVQMSDGTEFAPQVEPSSTYPFNTTIIQWEHALVTVDNNCKMTRWDQYGDNKEQTDVDDAMDAFFAHQGVKCNLNIEPLFWRCNDCSPCA